MGDHQRPKKLQLLGPNGRPAELPAGVPIVDAKVLSPREALQADIAELQAYVASLAETVRVHHEALVAITADLQARDARSLRGRIRRGVAHLEAWRLWCRGWAVELGLADPCDVAAYRRMSNPNADPLASASDNPEAMPKP